MVYNFQKNIFIDLESIKITKRENIRGKKLYGGGGGGGWGVCLLVLFLLFFFFGAWTLCFLL